MGKGKKRKKKHEEKDTGTVSESGDDTSDFSSVKSLEIESQKDKYEVFRLPNYARSYPEDGGNFEYIVFLESSNPDKPIGNRDMMSLSNCIKRYNKGVKQLQRINKFKIGVIFERPGLANAALANKKFLDEYKFKASIPAAASEVTGVIMHVPTNLSNEQIYSALTSTKNIVCIRRFMRKVHENGKVTQEPTKTVSITFSCPVLPESVDLNSWRFKVLPYIPPVKQCLRCLRYGHIGKFCKNEPMCSICAGSHNYTECPVNPKDAKCCHCQGNHIAISSSCPIKLQKVEENKLLVTKKSYAATLMSDKDFPKLNNKDQINALLNSETVLNLIIETIVKIVSQKKTNEKPICSKSVKETLLETLSKKKTS